MQICAGVMRKWNLAATARKRIILHPVNQSINGSVAAVPSLISLITQAARAFQSLSL
jgi:hypothetical protein